MAHPTILGFDISSTSIGWCLYDGAILAHGTQLLKHADINHRCRLARAFVAGLLVLHSDIDACAIEAPGGSYVGSVIAQCFVSGAVRSLLAERDIVICDVSPKDAKLVSTGRGDAKKAAMIEAAALAFGYYPGNLTIRESRRTLYAVCGGEPVYSEHEADAYAVALAGVGRVVVG